MESPSYLSPYPNSSGLSSSDYSSDYMADMYEMAPQLTNVTTKTTSQSTPRKSTKKSVSTFVQKLYKMLEDNSHGNLISWSPSGTSFSVSNAKVFASQVLPAHFKHSNFSSFVRLLNMYGFHKISKSPRGQRATENEIWEFSHSKLIRGRPDLLKDIKRKAMDSEMVRRETGDIQASFARLQTSQNELFQQFYALQENFNHLLQALEESKRVQQCQAIQIEQLLEQRGIPNDNNNNNNSQPSPPLTHHRTSETPPSLQEGQSKSYQTQQQRQQQNMLDEPFQMMVTTPSTSNANVNSNPMQNGYTPQQQGMGNSTPSTYWMNTNNNTMANLSLSQQPSPGGSFCNNNNNNNSQGEKAQQQQQQSNILYSPMTFQAAANTPLPPSPMMLASPELAMSPGSSEDSLGTYTFGFGHSNTLDPTFI